MPREQFKPSRTSDSTRARRLLWIAWLGSVCVAVLVQVERGRPLQSSIAAAIVLGAAFAAVAWSMRQLDGKNGVFATLEDGGIHSQAFLAQQKSYAWSEIRGAAVVLEQGRVMLQLRLDERSGRRDKSSFIDGRNPCRPRLPLAALDEHDRRRLLDAVESHLQPSGDRATPVRIYNHAGQELERLQALGRVPWVTYALIAANTGIWLFTFASTGGAAKAPTEMLLSFGANSTYLVQHGEAWRLFTSMFLHGTFQHLLSNMLGLLALGICVERLYGWRLFILLYLVAGLAGSAASLYAASASNVSAGASGAVFGVFGAASVAVVRFRKDLANIFSPTAAWLTVGISLLSLVDGFSQERIDNDAHVGGLLAGAALAMFLPSRLDARRFARQELWRGAAAALVCAAGLAAMVAATPPATFDPRETFDSARAIRNAFDRYNAIVALMRKDSEDAKAGRITPGAYYDRFNAVHVPALHVIGEDLARVKLDAGDPRRASVADFLRLVALYDELGRMELNRVHGMPVPVDPRRAREIADEMKAIHQRQEQRVRTQSAKATQAP